MVRQNECIKHFFFKKKLGALLIEKVKKNLTVKKN